MNYRCPICDVENQWENVDEYRLKASGMSMCGSCGFVTYPDKLKDKSLKEFYQDDYRKFPNANNFFTCERKVHYHAAFLKDVIKELKDKPINFLEIGAAFGTVCNWIQKKCPKWKVEGTELTTGFKRVAFHEYGLNLQDDFDKTKKYDFIMTYKVLEHQKDPDKELLQYRESLNDDGYLYVGVPIWFDKLCNFGMTGFDIEYYYSTNHVNVWSRSLFEGLLAKCGFKVVATNNTHYDFVYLCKKTDLGSVVKDSSVERKEQLKKAFAAYKLFVTGKYKEAAETYTYFPDAWKMHYELHRNQIHNEGVELIEPDFIDVMLKSNNRCPESLYVAADIFKRYEKYDKAIKLLEECLDKRANMPTALMSLGECHRLMGNLHQSAAIMEYLTNVSSQMRYEALSWYYRDIANIKTPHEGEK